MPRVEDVVVELAGELGAVVRLDHVDAEGEARQEVVEELDRGLLVAAREDLEHPQAGAVVDGRELVEPLALRSDGSDELDVDLDAVPRLGLLVALPALLTALVPLRAGQPVQVEAAEDLPDTGRADGDLVVALEVHRDLLRAEVVTLAQVHDLADDFGAGGPRAIERAGGPFAQALLTLLLVATEPLAERCG